MSPSINRKFALEILAKFEETACLRGALWAGLGNSTLKGIHLPSRDREGAVMLPNFASTSEVCPTSEQYCGLDSESQIRMAASIVFPVPAPGTHAVAILSSDS